MATSIGQRGRLLPAAFETPLVARRGARAIRRAHRAPIALATVAVVLGMLADVGPPAAATAPDLDAVRAELQVVSTIARMRALATASESARTTWEEADGRVLDETVRTELQAAVAHADDVVLEAEWGVVWPGTTLDELVAAQSAALAEASIELNATLQAVDAAVTEWEAEQARLAAEAEAARVAAEAAAAAANGRGGGARVAVAGSGITHVESMWTTGWQAELDACRGSVNFAPIASYLGGSFYAAEHWSCGGRAWGGIGAGALVEFPGHGVFRVAGIVGGLSYGVDASVLPGGYAGYYQTCIGGSPSNMTVWLLSRA